jgi:hypothetical protein
VTMMSSSEQKSLDLSIQAYRQLLRIYPKGFLAQFGDQLLQTFGDLARRAMKSGGYVPLLVLWSRMLPDAVSSALREHTGSLAWTPISPLRLRWIAGCGFGLMIGSLAANQLQWWGWRHYTATTVSIGIALGWMQWVWALRRRPSEAWGWIMASLAGTVLLPHALLYVVGSSTGRGLLITGHALVACLTGLGIGIFQFRILRREYPTMWSWIPVNMLGFLVGRLVSLSLVGDVAKYTRDSQFLSPDLQLLLGSFLAGAVLGYFTSIPLETALQPVDKENPDEVVQS